MELSILLILLNGTLSTRLIPLINPLTIVLKVLAIPSLIPVKIFPPELKTFFTLVHALVKVFLNQSGIPLKALVIPFFILVNREVTPFFIVFVTLESLDHKFSKVDTAVERMLDTLFETIVFIF